MRLHSCQMALSFRMAWPRARGPQLHICLKKRGTKMTILHIEHPIRDFDTWKKAFESDPAGRERSGVRRYQVLRPIDNPNYVMIDLDIDSASAGEAFLAAMREVWRSPKAAPALAGSPQTRIV